MNVNLWDSLAEKFWFDPNDENFHRKTQRRSGFFLRHCRFYRR